METSNISEIEYKKISSRKKSKIPNTLLIKVNNICDTYSVNYSSIVFKTYGILYVESFEDEWFVITYLPSGVGRSANTVIYTLCDQEDEVMVALNNNKEFKKPTND